MPISGQTSRFHRLKRALSPGPRGHTSRRSPSPDPDPTAPLRGGDPHSSRKTRARTSAPWKTALLGDLRVRRKTLLFIGTLPSPGMVKQAAPYPLPGEALPPAQRPHAGGRCELLPGSPWVRVLVPLKSEVRIGRQGPQRLRPCHWGICISPPTRGFPVRQCSRFWDFSRLPPTLF